MNNIPILKKTLETLYAEMNSADRVTLDPIEFPHRYKHPCDIEVAALISSSLAYGNIRLFKPVLESLFNAMGESPADFCSSFKPNNLKAIPLQIKYRFNSTEDIANFLFLIGKALKEHASLENLFSLNHKTESNDIRPALEGFVDFFLTNSSLKKKTPGFCQLLPSPKKGGACKRLNLFLRWMVRKDATDLGIWKNISPSQLVIPLDTHILRISLRLGLTTRKTANWKTAFEITNSLKKLNALDPVRYDFALCHFGVSGKCPVSLDRTICKKCSFQFLCKENLIAKP